MKKILKKIARGLPFALTKNIKYDQLTKDVIRQCCNKNTNCVDVGCHKGEILEMMMDAAPNGKHYGFEPIPELYGFLKEKFKKTNCTISDVALSDKTGIINFNYVLSNPSYSGIKKRNYDRDNEKDMTIDVRTEKLDDLLNENYKAGLIKIDVEGAELLVLKGAEKTIARSQPVIIFEFGLGASDVYETSPKELWRFFEGQNYHISLLDDWLRDKSYFTLEELEEQYFHKINHYFIAWPAA